MLRKTPTPTVRASPLFHVMSDNDSAKQKDIVKIVTKTPRRCTSEQNRELSSACKGILKSSERNGNREFHTPVSHVKPLVRSKLTPQIKPESKRNDFNSCDEDVRKFSRLGANNDRNSANQICTPHHHEEERNSGRDKKLLKRCFSETNLHKQSATPECSNKILSSTPRKRRSEMDDDAAVQGEESSNLTVGVRVRPLDPKEASDPSVKNVVHIEGNEVKILCESGTAHSFTYDHCFLSCDEQDDHYADQNVVFSTMAKPLIEKAYLGYNACLFAYGQTGSGKSYSMMGILDAENHIGKGAGIIPRFCFQLFEDICSPALDARSDEATGRYVVDISYFEIFNEKIHDLLSLSDGGKRTPLKVREHPVSGPYVVDLSVHRVGSYEELKSWLILGNNQRATAATTMNENSSRSHSIFSVVLTKTQGVEFGATDDYKHRSKINLIDLAGSERPSHNQASGDRRREGAIINCSLLTLGKVITALAENISNKKKIFVPYRDSALTWLLRESLGGNSQTTMLATISPSSTHVDETLSTLRYACQARSIVNYAHVNECPHERVIRELRAEVEELKSMQQGVGCRQTLPPHPRRLLPEDDLRDKELVELRQELSLCKAALREAQNGHKSAREITVKEELCDSEAGQEEQLCRLPFLVRIAADSVHFAAAHHFLQEGATTIGRLGSDPVPHMALEGSTIQPNHCTIENRDNKLILISSSDADLFVNNKRPKENQELQDGDWLAIGGIHHFRVFKRANLHKRHVHNHSFQDISSEEGCLLKTQNERMHEELKLWKGLECETRRNAENNEANFKQQINQLTLTAQNYKKSLEKEQAKIKELEQKMLQLENLYQKQRQHCQEILSHPCEHEIVSSYKSSMLEELEHILNETPREFEEIAVKVEEPSEEDISEQYEQMCYNDDEEMTEFQQSWNQELQDVSQENGDDSNNLEEQGNSSAETGSDTSVDIAAEIKELLGNTERIWNKIMHSAESNERLRTVDVLSEVVDRLRDVLDSVLLPAKSNLRTPNSQRVTKVVRFHLSESQQKSP